MVTLASGNISRASFPTDRYHSRRSFANLEDNSLLIEAVRRNVTVTSGQRAVLTCTFAASEQDLSLSSSHQLIWIRQNYASNSADSLLAHNQDLLIADHRMSIQRTDADYTLTITDVHADDEGTYTCEVNTQPPQKASVHLYVQGKDPLR